MIFKRAKIVYNLNFIYQSGLVEFLYETYNHPKSITLFGSFRKGEDIVPLITESLIMKKEKQGGMDFKKNNYSEQNTIKNRSMVSIGG